MKKKIKIPRNWRLLDASKGIKERHGDKISYDDGKTWEDSAAWRWGDPISGVVPTIRRRPLPRKAKKARK